MPGKLRVGILGATGTIGQRFIQMLKRHPQFEVTAGAAILNAELLIAKGCLGSRRSGAA
jgi:aspartate-semialdehyde dehydrogenase